MTHDIGDRLRDAITHEQIKRAEFDAATELLNRVIAEARSSKMKWAEISFVTGLDERALQHRHMKWAAEQGAPQGAQIGPVTPAEAAARLGLKVGEIAALIAAGELVEVANEVTGRAAVTSQSIAAYLARHNAPPVEELAAQYRVSEEGLPPTVPADVAQAYLDIADQPYARLRAAGYLHADHEGEVTSDSLRDVDRFLSESHSIEDAAKRWGVGRTTVDRWIRAGRVTPAVFAGAIADGGDPKAAPGRIGADELSRVQAELDAERKADADPDLLTDQQVAELVGVSRPAVIYAARRGDLARDASGRVRRGEAERWALARKA
ncbi:hypothetical protein [Leucobacter chromiireducens]|uniref:Helix-turn-helix domain-containing protein n=1 Tax=Leucobacter chromiireducens subsp. solipictus TaxID=398235 RepID=A0ABS1SG49_9MICO|nr:hypothetical protein [Leucobacter chromiireducens]MBL3679519.1 hypothetical protein [Leucobacter chromiireducens subsp. solipictus]